MSDEVPETAAASAPRTNPFVPISWRWRAALIALILIYQVFVPAIEAIAGAGVQPPLAAERTLVAIGYQLLLFSPLFFYGREFGWLHPLLFPPLLGLARNLLTEPAQILAPLGLFRQSIAPPLTHAALRGWNEEAVAGVLLEAGMISLFALATYYVGFFFGPRFDVPRLRFPHPKGVAWKASALVAMSLVVFALFIQVRGGLIAHLTSFALGRHRALGGTGHVQVVIGVGLIAALAWWALDPRAGRKPLFWFAAAMSIPLGFFVNGSRSTVVEAMVLFLAIWMLRIRRVPAASALAVGMLSVFLIGLLGAIRSSGLTGQVDLGVAREVGIGDLVEAGREEAIARQTNSGLIAVVAKVPEEVDFLYGRSYLAAVLFFVPRTLWEGKPRGAGPMVAAHLFRNQPMDDGIYEGGGIPAGAVGEAYWNFYVPGVALIFFVFGMFHAWLARFLCQNPRAPAAWVLYILLLVSVEMTATGVVGGLQQFIPAVLILSWMRAIRLGRSPALTQQGPPVVLA